MGYQTEHADALADVKEAGAAVTFTKTVVTGYDETTGVQTTGTVTVAGYAIRRPGKLETYERLGLIESAAPTLFFVPETYGEEPPLGASCSWGGQQHTAADVLPLEPDGEAIAARVVIKRGAA